MLKVQITIIIDAPDKAEALKRIQERIEPSNKGRAENRMWIDSVDSMKDSK